MESGISIEQALRQRSQQVCSELLGEATSPLGSGLEQAAAAAGSSRADGSGPVQAAAAAAGSSRAGGSGPVQAAAAAGSSSTGVSGPEQATAAADVSEARRSPMEMYNPWNLFQQEHKGKGWSAAKMSAMYKKWRSNPKFKMP